MRLMTKTKDLKKGAIDLAKHTEELYDQSITQWWN